MKNQFPVDYPEWDRMQAYILNDHKATKKAVREMVDAARAFLPYSIYWSTGQAIVRAPYGDYIWHFAVAIEQESRWNLREFQEGREFGHAPEKPYRDANPYKERWRNLSWDCGYILGLSEREKQQIV